MPAGTIAIGLWAVVFRMTRTSVIEVLGRDFIRTAHAKGVKSARILVHHVVRNALIPVITVLALHLGTLLGGTVLVEYVSTGQAFRDISCGLSRPATIPK